MLGSNLSFFALVITFATLVLGKHHNPAADLALRHELSPRHAKEVVRRSASTFSKEENQKFVKRRRGHPNQFDSNGGPGQWGGHGGRPSGTDNWGWQNGGPSSWNQDSGASTVETSATTTSDNVQANAQVTAGGAATSRAGAQTQTTSAAASSQTTSTSSSSSSSSSTYTGEATYYTQGGVAGACGTVNSDSALIVALQSNLYSESYCGKTVVITNTANSKTVTAKVADECPGCSSTYSLDLSTGAFDQIGDENTGVLSISWYFSD